MMGVFLWHIGRLGIVPQDAMTPPWLYTHLFGRWYWYKGIDKNW